MAKFERVLLKREWRTPLGRFHRSVDGVPIEVPTSVLRRYPLPSDAEIVGPNYVPPAEREEFDSVNSVEMTSAQIEEEVRRRVDAQLANEEARKRGEKNHELAEAADKAATKLDNPEEPDILDQSIKDIRPLLADMDEDQLLDLKSREEEGKNRASLIIEIEAALEDLEENEEEPEDTE